MLIPLDLLLLLLGITASTPALDAQVTFAGEAVTRMVQSYTGRQLILGPYSETFYDGGFAARRGEGGTPARRVRVNEWPVVSVDAVTIDGIAVAASAISFNPALGDVWVFETGWPQSWWAPLQVDYVGGYDPTPQDLQAVFLELVRRQLLAMGVDLVTAAGGTAPGSAPVRAVAVGNLRVEYAVQAVGADFARGGTGPLTDATLTTYATILDLYRGVRRIAAVGAA